MGEKLDNIEQLLSKQTNQKLIDYKNFIEGLLIGKGFDFIQKLSTGENPIMSKNG